mgnify:CR=1 FL=1
MQNKMEYITLLEKNLEFYFVQVTDLIIKPNFVQSSSMSLKIILCTRLCLDIVHIKVKST